MQSVYIVIIFKEWLLCYLRLEPWKNQLHSLLHLKEHCAVSCNDVEWTSVLFIPFVRLVALEIKWWLYSKLFFSKQENCNLLNSGQISRMTPTCVILGEREGELRPTHIVPVTVILCEVDLKPEGNKDWTQTSHSRLELVRQLKASDWSVSSVTRSVVTAELFEEAPGFRWFCVDTNVSKGGWRCDGKQLSLQRVHACRDFPSSTIKCPGRQAIAKKDKNKIPDSQWPIIQMKWRNMVIFNDL